jgi:hypothetical protein
MANDAKGKRKVFFTIGGRGLKPDVDVRNVSGGSFTKKVRKHKAVRNSQILRELHVQVDKVPLTSYKDLM